MHRATLALILVLILHSCNRKAQNESSKLHKITIATWGCFGKCPFEVVELNEDGTLWYYGGLFSEKKGTYKGLLSVEEWQAVVAKMNSINYLSLDSQYMRTMDDLRMEIVFRYGKGQEKRIIAQSASLPEEVSHAFMNVLSIKNTANLKKVEDNHIFDTSIQKRSGDE